MSDIPKRPSPLFLALSNVFVLTGVSLAVVYPKFFANPFDYKGNRERTLYWAILCLLGVVFMGAAYLARRPAIVAKWRVIASWVLAMVGVGYLVVSARVVIRVLQS